MEETLLDRIGRALYGPMYEAASKSELAEELGVARRVVQRIAAGDRAFPAVVLAQVRAKLVARGQDVALLVAEIDEMIAVPGNAPGTEEG